MKTETSIKRGLKKMLSEIEDYKDTIKDLYIQNNEALVSFQHLADDNIDAGDETFKRLSKEGAELYVEMTDVDYVKGCIEEALRRVTKDNPYERIR